MLVRCPIQIRHEWIERSNAFKFTTFIFQGLQWQHVATLQHFPKTQAPRHLKKTPTVGKRGWQQFGPRNPGAEKVTVTAGQHGPASLLEDLKFLCRNMSEQTGSGTVMWKRMETYGNIWKHMETYGIYLFGLV